MTTFKTENRHGYALKFSPNQPNLLAIATSQYYGFKGGGTLFLVSFDSEQCLITKECEMLWEDGLFDVVWSRTAESLLVTGSGDGTLQMWNYKHPQVNVKRKIIRLLHMDRIRSVNVLFSIFPRAFSCVLTFRIYRKLYIPS